MNTLLADLSEQDRGLIEGQTSLINQAEELSNKCDSEISKGLAERFPFSKLEDNLKEAEEDFDANLHAPSKVEKHIRNYLHFVKETKQIDDSAFWLDQIEQLSLNQKKLGKNEPRKIHHRLVKHWRKIFDKVYIEWATELKNEIRNRYLLKLRELLELLKSIIEQLEKIGLDPGFLLDFSAGELTPQNIQQIKRWAKYLTEDKGVSDLCNLMGKIRQLELSSHKELIRNTVLIPYTHYTVDSHEEIVGVKLGKEIENILPEEFALLSDPETEVLFDLKFVESRLLCFDMQAMSTDCLTKIEDVEQNVEDTDKLGPIIICVDTSGSMQGAPETIAKAITLFMSTKAKQQDRKCFLINFSTSITTLDLSHGYSINTLLDFLGLSFHGGTDVSPAICEGIRQMEKENYAKSDILIISDFVMVGLPETTLNAMKQQRSNGNRFYSLCIGECFLSERMTTLFDSEWVFNPKNASVVEVKRFIDGIK